MITNIKIINKEDILDIIPLLKIINTKTPLNILKERVLEMSNLPHYECIGLYIEGKLMGITGLWFTTRHYIGKSVEPDHVVIHESLRNKGLGKTFFNRIDNHVKKRGCEAIELNTFVNNTKSQKFYYNEGYEIYGFHFLKVLRDDKKFY